MKFFIPPLVLPQNCPLQPFLFIFEHTYSIGTLWNYQNFVKSRRRPFEQSLFLLKVPYSVNFLSDLYEVGDESTIGGQVGNWARSFCRSLN